MAASRSTSCDEVVRRGICLLLQEAAGDGEQGQERLMALHGVGVLRAGGGVEPQLPPRGKRGWLDIGVRPNATQRVDSGTHIY